MLLTVLLDKCIETESSDVHICVGQVPVLRYKGSIIKVKIGGEYTPTTDEEFIALMEQVGLSGRFSRTIDSNSTKLDAAITYSKRRFRLHLYKTTRGWAVAFRLLQNRIPHVNGLFLPDAVPDLVKMDSGLIIVTGATGSGKTTTLAGLVNIINNSQSKHIVTVEDPVEYIFESNKCTINQREVGSDVPSFEEATVDAMREDPDIILLGEMRDKETIANSLILAETGHLVLATLHAKSVVEAVNRVVDVFPPEQQNQARLQFSSVCRAILHQRLLTGPLGRVPLCELLVTTDITRQKLQQAKSSNDIRDYMRSDSSGSQHIADNAAWHVSEGRLHLSDLEFILTKDDISLVKAVAGGRND